MDRSDPRTHAGRQIQSVFAEAGAAADDAFKRLAEAEKLFTLCARQEMPAHDKGLICQRLWQVQRALGQHPLFYSQAGQDKYIYEHCFRARKDGVFVELGGLDGVLGSNTYYFEKSLGWTGLIVEPSPRMVAAIRKVRGCEVVHAAIADFDGRADFLEITAGYTQMSGLVDAYPEDMLRTVRAHPNHREQVITVSAIRLDSLLDRHAIKQVDYCSIDVEGAEFAIINAVDLGQLDIRVLSLENSSRGQQRPLKAQLEEANYELLTVLGYDEIYRRTLAGQG